MQNSSRNSDGVFEPFHVDTVPWEGVAGHVSRYKNLSTYGGGGSVGVGIDELVPGEYSNHFHYHLTEEEHIYILKGAATLHLGDKSYLLGEGSYCCFPAGQKAGHHLFNHTDAICTFMTIGENKLHDVYYYPQRGIVKIKGTGETFPLPEIPSTG